VSGILLVLYAGIALYVGIAREFLPREPGFGPGMDLMATPAGLGFGPGMDLMATPAGLASGRGLAGPARVAAGRAACRRGAGPVSRSALARARDDMVGPLLPLGRQQVPSHDAGSGPGGRRAVTPAAAEARVTAGARG
jgi:hypothetical protein